MIGTGELLIILCVVLILFGGKKLPELARNLGKGIREFKRACEGFEKEDNQEICQKEKKNIVEIQEKENRDE